MPMVIMRVTVDVGMTVTMIVIASMMSVSMVMPAAFVMGMRMSVVMVVPSTAAGFRFFAMIMSTALVMAMIVPTAAGSMVMTFTASDFRAHR